MQYHNGYLIITKGFCTVKGKAPFLMLSCLILILTTFFFSQLRIFDIHINICAVLHNISYYSKTLTSDYNAHVQ